MTDDDRPDTDLVTRVEALLEPGEIELNGVIVHTSLDTDQESRMHQVTIDVGSVIARHRVDEPTYIYAGNADPEFGRNQYQGLTQAAGEFVWECQQLNRDGTYDLVFYYEAGGHARIVRDLRERGHSVVDIVP